MKRRLLLSLAFASVALLGACAKKSADPTAPAQPSHSHDFPPPHGGKLVALGNHLYLLELVHDTADGKLTGYLFDAHAENFIRSPLAAIDLSIDRNGTPTPLTLLAVTNAATGETAGNSAEFAAQADWLKSTSPLNVTISVLMIRDATFTDVTATILPATQP